MDLTERRQRTEHIKEAARRLGFCEVGVARAEPLEEEFGRYLAWLERGYHATMAYLERNVERRQDVRQILLSAQSVVVVAYNYYVPARHKEWEHTPNRFGKISRYAWGEDYHDVLLPKLRALAAEIERVFPGAESRVYVDTGPVLEKAWAVRAGIGWQGKNTMVISRRYGSWIFLGVVITSAELEPDEPMRDYCGTCTACLQACPTGALVQPYILDASRCLSYWTIETKREPDIPPEIAERMEGWIFGCDICQEVCPWNRFQKPTDDPAFLPRYGQTCLELDAVLSMSPEEFQQRFRRSPLKRPQYAGIQRNARAWKEVVSQSSEVTHASAAP
ncbi:MAG: tRNA epoxyqueuosine(34) reductase QueG [Candidatus Kapabacteria bacterium]|nr:tRNA epoxyqueuosine(34) reductase QueG [Candidatus Kapabacteria bacterium]MDW8011905.1 tRNA epoxyqueuosine(34) reductase QueG [Bacteroidota bacterium]